MTIQINAGEHVGLIGTTGSGKTYYFRHELEPHLQHLVVIDTEERQFLDLNEIRGDPAHWVRKLPKNKPYRLRWTPTPSLEKEDMEKFAYEVTKYGQDMQIYIDELTDFSTAQVIGPWLRTLYRKARKRRISIYWASQRPAGVNKWGWDNSAHKFLFYVMEYDRAVLDKYYHGISNELARIPWKSYQAIYIEPSGATRLIKKAGGEK